MAQRSATMASSRFSPMPCRQSVPIAWPWSGDRHAPALGRQVSSRVTGEQAPAAGGQWTSGDVPSTAWNRWLAPAVSPLALSTRSGDSRRRWPPCRRGSTRGTGGSRASAGRFDTRRVCQTRAGGRLIRNCVRRAIRSQNVGVIAMVPAQGADAVVTEELLRIEHALEQALHAMPAHESEQTAFAHARLLPAGLRCL